MENYRIILPDGREIFETSNPMTAVRMLLESRRATEGTKIQCPGSYMRMLLESVISNTTYPMSAACRLGYTKDDAAMVSAQMLAAIAA